MNCCTEIFTFERENNVLKIEMREQNENFILSLPGNAKGKV